MRVRHGLLAIAVAAAGAAGCEDSVSEDPITGTSTVNLQVAAGTDLAGIRLYVDGRGIEQLRSARADYAAFIEEAGTDAFEVIVLGRLRSGPLLHADVPDVRRSVFYQASVLELSDADGNVLADPGSVAELEWLSPVAP